MHSPVLAIAWEIWRKNRIANWCVLALLPVSVVLFEGWLATAVLLGAFAAVLWMNGILPKPLILLALVWFWPAGELFQSVVHLARNRHR